MKAVVLHAAEDVRVDERPDPEPGPGQALLAVEWGGICGSDISYFRHGTTGTAVLRAPLILGHEVAGRVAALGEGVADRFPALDIGTPATVHPVSIDAADRDADGEPRMPDRLSGRWNLHSNVHHLGSAMTFPHIDGGFAELIVVDADQLRPLPASVDTRRGVLCEPLAVAMHAVTRARSIDGRGVRDRDVLVNGSGPIGVLVLAAARLAGARSVTVADLSADALAIAGAFGADRLVNLAAGDELPQDVELVFEASGSTAALAGALAATARGGTLVQVGNLPVIPQPAALGNLVTREITWLGSFRFIDEITDAVDAMAAGLDVSPLITHEFALSDAEDALRTAAEPGRSGKVLLRF